METTTWICDSCGCTLPTATIILNGVTRKIPIRSNLHSKWLQPFNYQLDLCEHCAAKIENTFNQAQLEMIAGVNSK